MQLYISFGKTVALTIVNMNGQKWYQNLSANNFFVYLKLKYLLRQNNHDWRKIQLSARINFRVMKF